MTSLHTLFASRRWSMLTGARASRKSHPNTTRLQFEMLEARRLLAVVGQIENNVIVSQGNGNTDAASLKAYLDPTNLGLSVPSFANVGGNSTNGASVVYLGNRWIITAAHVNTDSSVGPVRLGGNLFAVDNSSITILHNPDNSLADLKLVRLTTDPGLPAIDSSMISSSAAVFGSQVVMIGNGLNTGTEHFWSVNKSGPHWVWTDTGSQPPVPGSNDYAGFDIVGGHVIRWGDNRVLNTNVIVQTSADAQNNPEFTEGFTTEFDNLAYTGSPPQPYEAHGSGGDSGGAVFTQVGSQWKLSGIMTAIGDDRQLDSQPAGTELFGEQTLIADLSLYGSQIAAIVSQSSTVAGRKLFYANSVYDGYSGNPATAHDEAIAPDKVALLPGGGESTFANVSGYTNGINGIMVDLTAGGNHSALVANAAADFTFKVSGPFASNSPSTWTTLSGANLPSVLVRNAGSATIGGTLANDRIELLWPNQKVLGTWLEVIVKAGADSGLSANDVFYFGSSPGDTGFGNDPDASFVDATDEISERNHQESDLSLNHTYSVAVSNAYDVNKDDQVDATDQIFTRNFGNTNGELDYISIAGGGPFAPATGDYASAAVASALSIAASSTNSNSGDRVPTWPGSWPPNVVSNMGQSGGMPDQLAQMNYPRDQAILLVTECIDDKANIDQELLDDLSANLRTQWPASQ